MDAMRYDFVAILMNYWESFVLFHIAAERERQRGSKRACVSVCVQFMSVNVDILNVLSSFLIYLCIGRGRVRIHISIWLMMILYTLKMSLSHPSPLYLCKHIHFMFYSYNVVPFFWHFPLLLPSSSLPPLSPSPLPLPLLLCHHS